MVHLHDPTADFCPLPGNDCDRTKFEHLSVHDLKKTAQKFRLKNISSRVRRFDHARTGPFRSNNNIPMGHRIY